MKVVRTLDSTRLAGQQFRAPTVDSARELLADIYRADSSLVRESIVMSPKDYAALEKFYEENWKDEKE